MRNNRCNLNSNNRKEKYQQRREVEVLVRNKRIQLKHNSNKKLKYYSSNNSNY
jgi:hypothetical protein